MFINGDPWVFNSQVEELHRNGPWRTDYWDDPPATWIAQLVSHSFAGDLEKMFKNMKQYKQNHSKVHDDMMRDVLLINNICAVSFGTARMGVCMFIVYWMFQRESNRNWRSRIFLVHFTPWMLALGKSCNARNSRKPDILAAYHFWGWKSQIYITINDNNYLNSDSCLRQHFRGIWTARQWWKHQVLTFFLAQLTLSEESDADRMRIRWSSTSWITCSCILIWPYTFVFGVPITASFWLNHIS